MPKFFIISEDLVLSTLLHQFLINGFQKPEIKKMNSYAALRTLNEGDNFDIILLDNSITGAANYEIITYLRLNKKITTPVIYFSNMESDIETARQRGANYFFKKPFAPNELIEQISSILN